MERRVWKDQITYCCFLKLNVVVFWLIAYLGSIWKANAICLPNSLLLTGPLGFSRLAAQNGTENKRNTFMSWVTSWDNISHRRFICAGLLLALTHVFSPINDDQDGQSCFWAPECIEHLGRLQFACWPLNSMYFLHPFYCFTKIMSRNKNISKTWYYYRTG